jgi:CheY-like chemotaxis protein
MNQSEQRARLRIQVAEGRRLVLAARQACRELDGLYAARKDALSEGRRRGDQPASFSDASSFLGHPHEQEEISPPADGDILPSGACSVLLVVEPETDDYLLLERALRQADVQNPVFWAKNGSQALEMTSSLGARVDSLCLLTEVKLPDMDGFNLLREVRALRARKLLTVVILTGRLEPSMQTNCSACGANAFFVKSSRCGVLLETAHAVKKLLAVAA